MSLVLTSAFLLMLASSSFEVDVQIITKNEPWTEVDTAAHVVQAEEKVFGNTCISKETCGECTRNLECAWCKKQDMNYTSGGKKRCDYWETIERECGTEEMVTDYTQKVTRDSKGRFGYSRDGDKMYILIRFWPERDLPLVTIRFDNPPENVQVTDYSIICPDGWYHVRWEDNKTSCTDVEKDQQVHFQMRLKLLSCPDEWNPIMKIHIMEGEHVAVVRKVNLGIFCKYYCKCELPENEERNSPKCSGRGTYECGICRCPDNRYGKECECEGKPSGDYDEDDVNKACIAPGDTKICSGRGKCNHCGICECFNKTSVTGRFCQCDACPRSEDGQICGGKDHGTCVCGKCECTDEWTRPACDCTKNIESCRSPYNGERCHGFGECKCGKCQCFQKYGSIHIGPYCEDCPRCPRMSCRRCLEFY